ncbi:MAG TPA: septum formation initiator family protein [Syntrophomonadaceae bacterium]|nr:septum formation initiator family protein [Syntrophomonadaceae bacterium]
MARRHRRGCFNKRRLLAFSLLGLALCALFLPTEAKILRMQGELRQLQREERALLQKQQEFKEKIRFYSSDAYVEEAARRDLGLVKPGEVLVLPAVPGKVQPPPKKMSNSPYGD